MGCEVIGKSALEGVVSREFCGIVIFTFAENAPEFMAVLLGIRPDDVEILGECADVGVFR